MSIVCVVIGFPQSHFNTISVPCDLDSWLGIFDVAGFGYVVEEFLHVPGSGGAAFGTEAAVEADVFVFRHYAAGFEAVGDVDVLGWVEGGDF